jgi:hypothetical protein
MFGFKRVNVDKDGGGLNSMRRLAGLFFLMTFAVISASGCDLAVFPADLLVKPDSLPERKGIDRVLAEALPPGTRLLMPVRFQKAGAVNLVDLDGDRRDELVIVAGKKEDLGMTVLIMRRAGGGWKKVVEMEQPAHDMVDALVFRDVTGDQNPEILIGTGTEPIGEVPAGESGAPKTLSVYSFKQDKAVLLWNGVYNDSFVAEDLGGDRRSEIVRFQKVSSRDASVLRAHLTVCGEDSCDEAGVVDIGEMKCERLSMPVNGVKQLLAGRAGSAGNGLYVDVSVGAGSTYTELLTFDGKRLQRELAPEERELGCKWFADFVGNLDTRDQNGDGYPEIASTIRPENVRDLSKDVSVRVVSWYERHGERGLQRVRQEYLWHDGNGENRWRLVFPADWMDGIAIDEDQEDGLSRFYFADESGHRALLLSIRVGSGRDGSRGEQSGEIILIRKPGFVVTAHIPREVPDLPPDSLRRFNRMRIKEKELLRLFQIDDMAGEGS